MARNSRSIHSRLTVIVTAICDPISSLELSPNAMDIARNPKDVTSDRIAIPRAEVNITRRMRGIAEVAVICIVSRIGVVKGVVRDRVISEHAITGMAPKAKQGCRMVVCRPRVATDRKVVHRATKLLTVATEHATKHRTHKADVLEHVVR